MKRRNSQQNATTELRRRAEERLGRMPSEVPQRVQLDAMKQLHELQVHQIELEMQNQELQRIREELEDSLTRRSALYDQADELLRQNRALARRMFHMQETERRDLARELHDELGQWLTAIQAEAEAIRGNAGASRDPRLLTSAQAISDSAAAVHGLIQQMLYRLRPRLLDSLGLSESLLELTTQWGQRHPRICCELQLKGDLRSLPESLGITAYRIVQEALTNVARHSEAQRVSVQLRREGNLAGPDSLCLIVQDDGRGLDSEHPSSGLGLMGMRERAIAADGEFSLRSKPGYGVQIVVRLPFAAPMKTENAR